VDDRVAGEKNLWDVNSVQNKQEVFFFFFQSSASSEKN